jgi:glycosyltransferase involved in cell wall biosynthesis
MPTLLHVVPDLGVNGAARQLTLLAPALAKAGCVSQVVALRGCGVFVETASLGVAVRDLGSRHKMDPRAWLSLRRILRETRPDMVHAWRRPALRIAGPIVRWLGGPPLVASDLAAGSAPRPLDRWLLRRIPAVVAGGEWERARLLDWGVAAERIHVIPPAVQLPAEVNRSALLAELELPPDARLIACSGTMEPGQGFREAVWVFDILKYVYPELWLLVIGAGPSRADVEAFGRSLGRDDFRVRFAGVRRDAASLLALAEVVWVLGERGGRNVALEALAAGAPVIGRDRPDLREIMGPELSAWLIPKGDRHEAARLTRRLLDDRASGEKLRDLRLRRALEFPVDESARSLTALYHRITLQDGHLE